MVSGINHVFFAHSCPVVGYTVLRQGFRYLISADACRNERGVLRKLLYLHGNAWLLYFKCLNAERKEGAKESPVLRCS